jgi:hypothetical protein|tara:strand:- start:1061 stop:1342 length:282 start_codon:yes stop_codon:yes gene_type:complete
MINKGRLRVAIENAEEVLHAHKDLAYPEFHIESIPNSESIPDLITNLLHLSESTGVSPEWVIRLAERNYESDKTLGQSRLPMEWLMEDQQGER